MVMYDIDSENFNFFFIECEHWRPGVGVTKPISSVPLFFTFSVIVKIDVSYCISRLYLAGVAAARLQWHLSNMNVIQGI